MSSPTIIGVVASSTSPCTAHTFPPVIKKPQQWLVLLVIIGGTCSNMVTADGDPAAALVVLVDASKSSRSISVFSDLPRSMFCSGSASAAGAGDTLVKFNDFFFCCCSFGKPVTWVLVFLRCSVPGLLLVVATVIEISLFLCLFLWATITFLEEKVCSTSASVGSGSWAVVVPLPSIFSICFCASAACFFFNRAANLLFTFSFSFIWWFMYWACAEAEEACNCCISLFTTDILFRDVIPSVSCLWSLPVFVAMVLSCWGRCGGLIFYMYRSSVRLL